MNPGDDWTIQTVCLWRAWIMGSSLTETTAIRQAPTQIRFCVSWHGGERQVKEKVRTLVIATRELHGVVMDLEHVALAWCVRFAGHFPYRDGRPWTHCIPTWMSACVSPTGHACSMGRRDLILGSEQEEGSSVDRAQQWIILCSPRQGQLEKTGSTCQRRAQTKTNCAEELRKKWMDRECLVKNWRVPSNSCLL